VLFYEHVTGYYRHIRVYGVTVERIRDGEEKGILGREHNGQSEGFRILLAESELLVVVQVNAEG
jgi:hypothetical protein